MRVTAWTEKHRPTNLDEIVGNPTAVAELRKWADVQRALADHYNDGERLPREAMFAVAEAWRPWRSVATWYLWRSLDPIPVEY